MSPFSPERGHIMNINEYFGIGTYHGLGYYKGIVSAILPENHDYGEYPPEERDNEYYAKKYADRFRHIWCMIENGELQFDSKQEEDDAWNATCDAWYRYRERAEMYYAKKNHCEEQTAERYKQKHAVYPDWYKPSA